MEYKEYKHELAQMNDSVEDLLLDLLLGIEEQMQGTYHKIGKSQISLSSCALVVYLS